MTTVPKGGIKIGEAARRLGTTTRALRFYEEEGLLAARRTEGDTRYYTEGDLDRLRAIRRLTEIGVSIETIKRLATARQACRTGAESSRKVTALVESLFADIAAKRRQLDGLERDARSALTQVGKCRRCRNKPNRAGCPMCPINGKLGHVEMLNLIWDQS